MRWGTLVPLFIFLLFIEKNIFAFDALSDVKKTAISKKLWESKRWHRLLHYRRNILSGVESEADGPGFFVHKNGKTQPKNELLALIDSLGNLNISKDHPLCKFPARFKWLKEQTNLPIDLLGFEKCQEYQNYLKRHNSQKLHLVFSSYYLESPASTFGHTLFRLSKSENLTDGKYSELLDTAISYGANMTTDNPILYSLLGTMGGFQGSLVSLPYFYKIREYNDHESRDLWSYELNLSKKEIATVVDHIWELGQTVFDYYYFDENCAYYLLTILEAAKEDLELINKLPIYVIPVDTIHIVYNVPHLVKKVHYRPSIRKKTNFFAQQLSDIEKETLHKVIDSQNEDLIFNEFKNEKSQSYILDTLINYIDLKFSNEILTEKGHHYDWKMRVLEKRSKVNNPGILKTTDIPLDEQPHKGHGSARARFIHNYHSIEKNSTQIEYRFAMHEILDPFEGQPKTSSIEFLNTQIRYYHELEKLRLHRLKIVQIQNLHPWSEFQKLPTLFLNFGFKKANDLLCYLCTVPNFTMSWGSTHQIGTHSTLSLLINTDLTYSSQYIKNSISVGIGPEINLFHWWGSFATTKLSSKIDYYFTQDKTDFDISHESSFHILKNIDIVLQNEFKESRSSHSLGISFFH